MAQTKDILFIDPGHAFGIENRTSPFITENFTVIDQYDFADLDVTPYKCIVVHDFVDQVYLTRHRAKIEDYLNDRNIVVWGGHLIREWLPGCPIFTPKIVNGVANDNFGLLVDIGNFMCADEDPAYAVGVVAPYAFHVHAKDFTKKSGNGPLFCDGFFKTRGGTYLKGAIVGHGDVPVYQCLQTLIGTGYDGYITVEFEGLEDQKLGTQYGLNTLKKMCESIG